MPPGPACPLRLTVPVEELPPPTELGDTLRLVRAAAVIVSGADCVLAPWAPEITTDALLDTARVVTVNVAEVEPLGTVTVAGTFAFGLLEERLTVKPAALAGPVSVTVPVAGPMDSTAPKPVEDSLVVYMLTLLETKIPRAEAGGVA